MGKVNGSLHQRFQRLHSREAEKIHAGWKELGWTQERMHKETKIDKARLKLFFKHKCASISIGLKLALTISSALATRNIQQPEN